MSIIDTQNTIQAQPVFDPITGENLEVVTHESSAQEVHTTTEADTSHSLGEGTHELNKTPTLFAEPVFHTPFLPITNSLITSWIAVLIIVILSVSIKRKVKKVPGALQQIFEIIIEGGYNLCDQVTNSRKLSEKIFPLAFAIFFFVLLNNWLGLLPLTAIGVIQVHEGHQMFVPFIRGGTADINTTLALGLMTVIGSNIFGIFAIGGWKTLNKYLNIRAVGKSAKNIKKEPTGAIVGPIKFFVGILEFIGELAKIASLSFRLFGNIFAGEVLLVSMSTLVAYFVPVPFLFLEVIVGIIQALIFSMLTLVYFTIASHDHDEEHHEEHHEEEHHALQAEGVH